MSQTFATIARLFHWEMGHRLPFHESGCANIHGHSYRLWVEVEGTCDQHGMLIDYGLLKQAVQPVLEPLDHAFLCSDTDAVMLDVLRRNGFKHVVVPFHSTAENICAYLLEGIWVALGAYPQITGLSLKLHETDNSYATARRQASPA